MKKSNKLTAAVTASMVASTLVVPAAFASTQFTDISGSYAKDAILELVEAGILNGTGEGKFNPTGKITRQDFAIILAKALELDTEDAPATPTFSDVPATHYSYKYVEAAVAAELIAGTGEGKFGLGQNLTRQDMAVLFVRAMGVDAEGFGDKLEFSDAATIANYAKDAVGYAVEAGLMNGVGNNTFNPRGLAERQQVALVASNFLKVVNEAKQPVVATGATLVDNTTIEIDFNKANTEFDAKKVSIKNKATSGEVSVAEAALSEDKKSATVKVAALAAGTTYTVTYGDKSFDVTTQAPTTVEADAVTVLNNKQIKVAFNGAIDTDAVTAGNFLVGGNAIAGTVAAADEKTVIITLTTAANNQDGLDVTVKNVKSKTGATVAEKKFSVIFFDSTVPTMVSAEVTGKYTVKVKFSEPLRSLTGASISVDNNVYGAAVSHTPGDDFATLTFGTQLPEGNHEIKLAAGAVRDYANATGYTNAEGKVSFNYAIDNTAATFTVKEATPNKLVLKFSEKVNIAQDALNVYALYNGQATYRGLNAQVTAADEVTVTFANPIPAGNVTFYINNPEAAVDAWGNKATAAVQTVSANVVIDTVKPAVTDAKFDTTTAKFKVTFSEVVSGADAIANYTLKDSTGTTVAITGVTYDAATKTATITSAALKGGAYTLTVANVTDTATPVANKMDAYTATLNIADTVKPLIVDRNGMDPAAVRSDINRTLTINFDEAMAVSGDGSILDKAKYSIEATANAGDFVALPEGATVTAGTNNKSVVITFPADYVFTNKFVRMAVVKDVAGNVLGDITNGFFRNVGQVAAQNASVASVKKVNDTQVVVELDQPVKSVTTAGVLLGGDAAASVGYENKANAAGKIVGFVTYTKRDSVTTNFDAAGTPAFTLDATNGIVTMDGTTVSTWTGNAQDKTLPTVAGVEVASNGKKIAITFSEAINPLTVSQSAVAKNGFTVAGAGTLTKANLSNNGKVLVLEGEGFVAGTTTVSYDANAGITDGAANALAAFSAKAVGSHALPAAAVAANVTINSNSFAVTAVEGYATVNVYNATGTIVASGQADANGALSLTGLTLAAGNYYVEVVDLAGNASAARATVTLAP